VYEEGIQIPMLKILRAGEPNRDVIEIIRTNVRQPDETIGDIYAQISSNEVGAAAGSWARSRRLRRPCGSSPISSIR